jgi:hypothetical protein
MSTHIIPDENGKGFTFASVYEDIEFADPIKYFSDRCIESKTKFFDKVLVLTCTPDFDKDSMRKVAHRNATEFWEERLKEIMAAEVPECLFALLKTTSKTEQVKLLRGLKLTPESLMGFIFRAFTDHGFTYSQYHCKQYPKGTSKADLPKLATLDRETGKVTKVGETSLTDGQIKQAIEQRRVVSVKFLDRGAEWHCFFITYRSIGGEESWKNGQPHFHYISDKFGISRDEAVKQFKGDRYPITSVHIELLDYGNQPEKK